MLKEKKAHFRLTLLKLPIGKTTTLHVHRPFFYISFPSLHNYDVKIGIFTFYGGLELKTTTAFFFFSWPSRIQAAPEKIANIWRIERGGISTIKFEAARIHFLIAFFEAVAILVA